MVEPARLPYGSPRDGHHLEHLFFKAICRCPLHLLLRLRTSRPPNHPAWSCAGNLLSLRVVRPFERRRVAPRVFHDADAPDGGPHVWFMRRDFTGDAISAP